MQRGKHVHAEMDERHLTHPANAQDGGVPGSHRWIRDGTAQQQIADIEEKEEQSERQPCVPGPPRAPDGLPQMGPVVKTMAQKTVPTSADAAANRSSRGSFVKR